MKQPEWLPSILSICENTPYSSVLTVSDPQELSVNGDVVFKLDCGRLTFEFFVSLDFDYETLLRVNAQGLGKDTLPVLNVPDRDFAYPVSISTFSSGILDPIRRSSIKGIVDAAWYGSDTEQLKVVDVWLRNMPTHRRGGYSKYSHYEGVTANPIRFEQNGDVVLPVGAPSLRRLEGFELETDEWTVELLEIPMNDRQDPTVSHLCSITKNDDSMTGEVVRKFLGEDLNPFLSLVFGQRIEYELVAGSVWAMSPGYSLQPPRTLQRNWYLRETDYLNLSPLFQNFCRLPTHVKSHWQKVIQMYVSSEEVVGSLGRPTIAASLSFAALEGLTRSIINIYPEKEDWLTSNLALKRDKSVTAAIHWVMEKLFEVHSDTFKQAITQIRDVRNDTVHLNLTHDEDSRNAYYRWNSSQFLIEVLLLGTLGLNPIPNRTSVSQFWVMGEDMLKEQRKEELDLDGD